MKSLEQTLKHLTYKQLVQKSVFASTQVELDTILKEIKSRSYWMDI